MKFVGAALCGFLALSSTPASATLVFASLTTPTDLGLFGAGTYQITASGVIDIAGPVGVGGFDLDPAGRPTSTITVPGYGSFNPNGGALDPFTNQYGVSGPIANLGALLGAFVPNPAPGTYFVIGYGTVVTLNNPGHIYAQVNDVVGTYSNNFGAFDVTVSAAVPELSTWAMMIIGFCGVGLMRYRRSSNAVTAATA